MSGWLGRVRFPFQRLAQGQRPAVDGRHFATLAPARQVVRDGDEVAVGRDQPLELGAEGDDAPAVAVGGGHVEAFALSLLRAGAAEQLDLGRLVGGLDGAVRQACRDLVGRPGALGVIRHGHGIGRVLARHDILDPKAALDDVAGAEQSDRQGSWRVAGDPQGPALQEGKRPAAAGDPGERLPHGEALVEHRIEAVAARLPGRVERMECREIDAGVREVGAVGRPGGIGEGPGDRPGLLRCGPVARRVPERQLAGDDAVDHPRRALGEIVGGAHPDGEQGGVAERAPRSARRQPCSGCSCVAASWWPWSRLRMQAPSNRRRRHPRRRWRVPRSSTRRCGCRDCRHRWRNRGRAASPHRCRFPWPGSRPDWR